ncbi:hypothetical protein CPT_Slocum_148 [Serratia phage Slocum]|nr:hypothetical protein CPT_Slocum_148 [Serratia phage Slocum]URC22563.1 hypothetical protein KAMAJI_01350 [Serratia phage vB_SmaM-Kamaji]
MKKSEIVAKCAEFGEFYIHYEKLKPGTKGTTYLQGTMDFEGDRYIQRKLKEANGAFRNEREGFVLVFSRTNDNFRYIPVEKIRRITSLQSELDRASPVGQFRR